MLEIFHTGGKCQLPAVPPRVHTCSARSSDCCLHAKWPNASSTVIASILLKSWSYESSNHLENPADLCQWSHGQNSDQQVIQTLQIRLHLSEERDTVRPATYKPKRNDEGSVNSYEIPLCNNRGNCTWSGEEAHNQCIPFLRRTCACGDCRRNSPVPTSHVIPAFLVKSNTPHVEQAVSSPDLLEFVFLLFSQS